MSGDITDHAEYFNEGKKMGLEDRLWADKDRLVGLLQELVEAKKNAKGKMLSDYVLKVQKITKEAEQLLGGKESVVKEIAMYEAKRREASDE